MPETNSERSLIIVLSTPTGQHVPRSADVVARDIIHRASYSASSAATGTVERVTA